MLPRICQKNSSPKCMWSRLELYLFANTPISHLVEMFQNWNKGDWRSQMATEMNPPFNFISILMRFTCIPWSNHITHRHSKRIFSIGVKPIFNDWFHGNPTRWTLCNNSCLFHTVLLHFPRNVFQFETDSNISQNQFRTLFFIISFEFVILFPKGESGANLKSILLSNQNRFWFPDLNHLMQVGKLCKEWIFNFKSSHLASEITSRLPDLLLSIHFAQMVELSKGEGALVSVFLLGGASFLARYYRFISRSKTNNRRDWPVKGDSPFDQSDLELGWPKGTESARKSLRIGDIWCPWLGFFHHGLIQSKMVRGARPGRRPLARVWGQWSELFF